MTPGEQIVALCDVADEMRRLAAEYRAIGYSSSNVSSRLDMTLDDMEAHTTTEGLILRRSEIINQARRS